MITVEEFLESANRKLTYKMVHHSFKQKKGVGKSVCSNCGLVALNNKFTRWAIDKGCFNDLHQGYKSARKRYTSVKD